MTSERTLVDSFMTVSHDISVSPHPSVPDRICVDRLYQLHWPSFTDVEHEAMRRALSKLPGAVAQFRWYSDVDDPESGFLQGECCVEGLQITGSVSESQWQDWCDRMHHHTCFLPYYA